jgi:hypothetical protein
VYVPCAANCSVKPAASEAPPLTAIEVTAAFVTVSASVPETLSFVAIVMTDPFFFAVRRPAPLTDAIELSESVHVTCEVRSEVLPSLYLPCALN